MNINKLMNKAEGLVTQLTAKDECEKRVLDAVSNNKYAAPRSLLNELAEDTFSHESYSAVMRMLWKTIASPPRNWRSIAKALVLLDHLVKNGAEKVVADAQNHIHDITYLHEFSYIDGNLERGDGVREKAQDLVSLLGNPNRIQAERRRAKDLRAQYSGFGADAAPRLSTGGGSGGGGSSRDFHGRRDRDAYDDRGYGHRGYDDRGYGSGGSGGDGGSGRSSGQVSNEWQAGYDRSPTPPPIETRRVIGGGAHGRSESIDFDEGREGYSSRLSRFQEQERREASMASRPRRGSKGGGGGDTASKLQAAGGGRSASSSKTRSDEAKKPTGPDLLSGDDPFPATAPSRPENDFSSFTSFVAAPQVVYNQGGAPLASAGIGWNGDGGGMQPQQQQYPPPAQAGQMVPYGQRVPGAQRQPQTMQQQPMQHGMQAGMSVQPQAGWDQQGMQQQGGYEAQFGGQQHQYGQPQQHHQHVQQHAQMQMQPQQQQQYHQQYQPAQPQQAYQQQQQQQLYQQQQPPYQQQQPPYQQQQPPYQQQQPPYRQQQQPYQQQPQQSHKRQPPHQSQQLPQQPFQAGSTHQAQPPQQAQHQQQQATQQRTPVQQPFQHPQPYSQQQEQQRQPPPPQAQQPQAPPPQTYQPQSAAQHLGQAQAPAQETSGSHGSQQAGGSTHETERVPTEIVRAGIAGIDLAAAVGGLRQTGFKPSDVGKQTIFSGQGQRGSDGRHVGEQPLQQRTSHPAPPQPSVEYVEEGQGQQQDEVIVRASTREFLGARSGLNKTGLSDRLQETPQPPPPPPPQQQQQQQQHYHQQQTPTASTAVASGAAGMGQWQGLPQQGQQQGGGVASGGTQAPSWQTRQGGLKTTGLMKGGGSGAASGQGQGQGSAPSAPWQQGAAGLRRTGL